MSLNDVMVQCSRLFCFNSCAWGAVLTLHAVARDFVGLMIFRTFLGALESPITPGFSLITSMWYTPREHVSRHCVWFAGGAACSLPGCLIAYGVLKYHGDLAQWRVRFHSFSTVFELSDNKSSSCSLSSGPLPLPGVW
jgi:MFS family permease